MIEVLCFAFIHIAVVARWFDVWTRSLSVSTNVYNVCCSQVQSVKGMVAWVRLMAYAS